MQGLGKGFRFSLGVWSSGETVVLRGSWDLVTRVTIKVTTLITPLRVLLTLLTQSHDPPSRVSVGFVQDAGTPCATLITSQLLTWSRQP